MRLTQRPKVLHHRIVEALQRLESYTVVTFAIIEAAALSRSITLRIFEQASPLA